MEKGNVIVTNNGHSQANRKLIIGIWIEGGSGLVVKVGKLENFLKFIIQGDAYLEHESNVSNIFCTYVPRWNFEFKPGNHGYLFRF